ncbi:MAG: 30S ribosomal protein S9 [Patescibacteria group bacterium]
MPIKKTTTTAKIIKAVKKDKPVVSAVKKIAVKPVKADKIEKKPAEMIIPEAVIQIAPEMEMIDGEEFVMPATLKGGPSRYIETVGRRKTSSARVRLYTQGAKSITVNGQPYGEYFPKFLHKTIEDSLDKLKCLGKFGISAVVNGGGLVGQAEAIRHGIARALVELNPYFKKRLKKSGYLTRDPRMRERKKFGLNRARRAPQWSKR